MAVLDFPYPGEPPPSPYLGGMPGGARSYEHIATGVRAELFGGVLSTPVPRASFHGEELANAFGLGSEFRAAWAFANRDARDPARPAIDPALGLAFWRFTVARGDLRRGWPAADIIVPDLLLLARRHGNDQGGKTTTVLVWPHDVRALVIPDAAEHIIVKVDPAHPSVPRSAVLVPRDSVIALAGDRAVAFAVPVAHWLYRGGSRHHEIIGAIRSSAGEPVSAFRAVRPDEVTDSE
jgi:hypothetical protein